jgi:hypothetical protein
MIAVCDDSGKQVARGENLNAADDLAGNSVLVAADVLQLMLRAPTLRLKLFIQ